MAEAEVNEFLSHLAIKENVSASTQNQALSALLFLYRYVLDRQLGELGQVIRARKSTRLPVVLTREEVIEGRALVDGNADVRHGDALDGVPAVAHQGHRLWV